MSKNLVIYIIHPCTSGPSIEENQEQVDKLVRALSRSGIVPICTHRMYQSLAGEPEGTIIDMCKSLIDISDAVLLAGDWVLSKGCREELRHALSAGKVVHRAESFPSFLYSGAK